MPASIDFRLYVFSLDRILSAGRYLGHRTYWKLFFLENIFRILINSILTVSQGQNWWELAVDKRIRKNVERFQIQYSKKAWRSNPGKHGLYYVGLSDLSEIMRANADFIREVIPDIDDWLVNIETLRIPRNTLAHMNSPSVTDLGLIDQLYILSRGLLPKLSTKKIQTLIPT